MAITRTAPPSGKGTIHGVQVLRGAAAVLVILYHVTANLHDAGFPRLPVLAFGNGGVDLFFLISGFVMAYTTREWPPETRAWWIFLRRRLQRIVPLYWALTSLKVAAVLAVPALFRNDALTVWNIVASYLFIPAWDAKHAISPVISAGWTLCFEMFFYIAFAACLALRQRPLTVLTPLFVLLAAVGTQREPSWGAVATLLDPLLLEFVAGMWIATLARPATRDRTATWSGVALIGSLALVCSELVPAIGGHLWRVVAWGLPAAALLWATVSLERQVPFHRWRVAQLIGDASYSIYLTHVLVLPVMIRVLRGVGDGMAVGAVVSAVLVAGSVLAGLVVYAAVERPLTRLMRGLSTRQQQQMRPGGRSGGDADVIISDAT